MEEYYYLNNNSTSNSIINNNTTNQYISNNQNNNCCSATIANNVNNNETVNNNINLKSFSNSNVNNNNNNNDNKQTINNYYFYDQQFNNNNGNNTQNHSNSINKRIKTIDNLNFIKEYVTIKCEEIYLEGIFNYNELSKGVIIFVHGIGSSRFSPRNLFLSKFFQSLGFSTLLFDIMTPQEERLNNITGEYKYNINFISKRIISATQFINSNQKVKRLPIILFGSSTGSAGIIESESKLKSLGININSIISRSGRLSLCNRNTLGLLNTPILLLCGGDDKETIEANKQSLDSMHYCQYKKLEIISNSSHLFVETGALEKVAKLSFNFLNYHLNI